MKVEIKLSEAEHRLLLTASSHDHRLRSLESFSKACFLRGLTAEAAEFLNVRQRNANALANAINANRTKREPVAK
jgi:hypothetical protein